MVHITTDIKNKLISILGQTNVIENLDLLQEVSKDYTEDLSFLPELLVIPENEFQISETLKFCNQNKIPVYTRGAGTGLSGGCLPVNGGIVLSTKKLDKIVNIDLDNLMVTVEPGVINQDLKNILSEYNLTYPPDPASLGSCTIGGNVAHGSGGPRAVKYGITRDYVINLQVVLANGEIIWTGANTYKNSTGFSLTHLFIGSEGLLAVITKIVLKIIPKTQCELLMLAMFETSEKAAQAVNSILLSSIKPTGLELMEKNGVDFAINATKKSFPQHPSCEFYLMVILDGNSNEELELHSETIFEILDSHGAIEVFTPPNSDVADDWWKIRRSIGEVVKQNSVYKEEDTVVPPAALPELLRGVKQIGLKYGFTSVCYGHAGDGNLHVNILKNDMSNEKWINEIPKAIIEIFELCKNLGGTISGEHGIGLVQKPFLDVVFSQSHWNLMKGIKQVFDPENILNPGKWIESV